MATNSDATLARTDLSAVANTLGAALGNTYTTPATMASDYAQRAQEQQMLNSVAAVVAQTDAMASKTKEFNALTDLLGQMNEAYAANKYVGQILTSEGQLVDRQDRQARNAVFREQQRFAETAYRRHYYEFVSRVVVLSALVTCALAILACMWRQGLLLADAVFYSLAALVLLVYAFVLVVWIATAARRRQYHWRQMYWSVSNKIRKAQGSSASKKC